MVMSEYSCICFQINKHERIIIVAIFHIAYMWLGAMVPKEEGESWKGYQGCNMDIVLEYEYSV